ncbi:hypothetical protein B0H14DRAFT_1166778 [Mycena olivaceomarginata]|nr:hypothetical protein B0H14DRAFT_1166778 [Mycena olivaceomarginata]
MMCASFALAPPALFVFAPTPAPIPARAAGTSLPPLCPFSSFSRGVNQCLMTHTYRIFTLIFLSFSSVAERRPPKLNTLLGPFPLQVYPSHLIPSLLLASPRGSDSRTIAAFAPLSKLAVVVSSRPQGSEGLGAACTRTPSCTPRERCCVLDAADGVALVGAKSARSFLTSPSCAVLPICSGAQVGG